MAIAEDQQGTLWLGTHYSGLHHFDPATGKFTVYKSDADSPGSLRDDMVPTVHIDRLGAIWVGTQSGLDRLDPKTKKFTAYHEQENLPGSTVSCILEDKRGNLWTIKIAFHWSSRRSAFSIRLGIAIATCWKAWIGDGMRSRATGGPPLIQRCLQANIRSEWRAQPRAVLGANPGLCSVLPAWWQTWWFRVGATIALVALIFWRYRVRIQNIQNRERDFRKLAENAPDMVMRFDSQLRCVYVNPLVEHYIGLHPKEILGKTHEELAALGKHLPILGAGLRAVFDRGQPIVQEVSVCSPQGERHFETRLAPEFGTDNSVKSVLAITRDVTERKRTEAELRRSEEAAREAQAALAHVSRVTTVGELTASIAHELNQPLTGVVTNGNACLR